MSKATLSKAHEFCQKHNIPNEVANDLYLLLMGYRKKIQTLKLKMRYQSTHIKKLKNEDVAEWNP